MGALGGEPGNTDRGVRGDTPPGGGGGGGGGEGDTPDVAEVAVDAEDASARTSSPVDPKKNRLFGFEAAVGAATVGPPPGTGDNDVPPPAPTVAVVLLLLTSFVFCCQSESSAIGTAGASCPAKPLPPWARGERDW